MTKEMIIASWGEPEDEKKNITKNAEKLKWYYGGRKTIQNSITIISFPTSILKECITFKYDRKT